MSPDRLRCVFVVFLYVTEVLYFWISKFLSTARVFFCTDVHYKPTNSHSYLLYSSSHPSYVKNSIPYSQFLRLCRLSSGDSDFSLKSEETCDLFDKPEYPSLVVQAGHHRAQQIDQQSALQTPQKENNDIIPFTLTFHPLKHAVKSMILKNLLQITSK